MRTQNHEIKKSRNQKNKIVFVFLCFCVFVLASPAFAQTDVAGLAPLSATGLASTELPVVIGNIIRIFLGLLGVIAIALVIYGGFLRMTAGGNEEKVATANKLLLNATIGLVIILTAFSITSFILSRLLSATGAGGGGTVEEPGTGNFDDGGGGLSFTVQSIQPNQSDTNLVDRNVVVRLTFTSAVNAESVRAAGNITIAKESDKNTAIVGSLLVDDRLVTFIPDAACLPSAPNEKCFDASTKYVVTAKTGGVKNAAGDTSLQCGRGFGRVNTCSATFTTGTRIDTQAPTITITSPSDRFVRAEGIVPINFTATDDGGVAYVTVKIDDETTMLVPQGPTSRSWESGMNWTTGNVVGSSHTITARVFDTDSHNGEASVTVKLRAVHCYDGQKNVDEKDVDCGGADCGACTGDPPGGNGCAVGVVQNGICVEYPTITRVTPTDGAPGSLVTIYGDGFGDTPGKVTFLGAPNTDTVSDDVDAVLPTASCGGQTALWKDNRIIVVVPGSIASGQVVGVAVGPIKVTKANTNWDDTKNGPGRGIIVDFTPNLTTRPGICAVTPENGKFEQPLTVRGVNLVNKATNNGGAVKIGDTDVDGTLQWSDTAVSGGTIPNIQSGTLNLSVAYDNGTISNFIPFVVEDREDMPKITKIDPESGGKPGTYMTISGQNFGRSGNVYFIDTNGNETPVVPGLPEACTTTYWTPTSVTVKVPDVEKKAYAVIVETGAVTNPLRSNRVSFTVNTLGGPGICRVNPDNGPVGTSVTISGQGFGDKSTTTLKAQFLNQSGANPVAAPVPASGWSSDAVATQVPFGAFSLSQIRISTAPPKQGNLPQNFSPSNTLPFSVRDCRTLGCENKPGEPARECCGDGVCQERGTCAASARQCTYAWSFTTGSGGGGGGDCSLNQSCPSGNCNAGLQYANGICVDALPHVVENAFCSSSVPPVQDAQSPSPYRDSVDACTGAMIVVRFTLNMQDASLEKTANVALVKCNGGERLNSGSCPAITSATNIGVTFDSATGWVDHDLETGEGAKYKPKSALAPDTWYRVTLDGGKDGFKSEKGKLLDGNSDGKEGDNYEWSFHTGKTACSVDHVWVTPQKATIESPAKTQDFTAEPTARNCNILNPADYTWTWSSDKERSATVDPKTPDAGTTATPFGETVTLDAGGNEVDSPVSVKTTISAKSGVPPIDPPLTTDAQLNPGKLTIRFPAPYVVDAWPSPDCEAACGNAAIGAQFSADINKATFDSASVEVYKCDNEDCEANKLAPEKKISLIFPPIYNADPTVRTMDIMPRTSLSGNNWWRVILRPTILGMNGKALTSLNFPSNAATPSVNDAYSWTFKTKAEPATCVIDRVGVEPANLEVKVTYADYPYSSVARGSPDICSDIGQRLNTFAYNWQWDAVEQPPYENGYARVTNSDVLPRNALDGKIDPEQSVRGFIAQKDTWIKAGTEGKQCVESAMSGNQCGKFSVICGMQSDSFCPEADPIRCPFVDRKPYMCGIDANKCCATRPTMERSTPEANESGVCRNTKIEIEFNQRMDESSFAGNVFLMKGTSCAPTFSDTCTATAVKGSVDAYPLAEHMVLKFTPKDVLDGVATGTQYYLEVRGELFGTPVQADVQKVRAKSGVAMAGAFSIPFKTKDEICAIESVKMNVIRGDQAGARAVSTDLFTCAGRDDCPDDFPSSNNAPGNQHSYFGDPLSSDGQFLDYSSSEWMVSPGDFFDTYAYGFTPEAKTNTIVPTAKVQNSEATVALTFHGRLPDTSSATGEIAITSFICDNPWPPLPPSTTPPTPWPWKDPTTNTSFMYCRDAGKQGDTSDDLPALKYPPVPAGAGSVPGIIKDFLFPQE